jgi:acetyltransferase-like isoleucine patch superfamily enzyme
MPLTGRINQLIDAVYNRALLKYKKVKYSSYPIIHGRIIVDNNGSLQLGREIRFNCSVKSNMVGLFKTCTISVSPGATLEIGDNSGFSGVSIYCSQKITIGKYVKCGGNVSIWDTDFHPLDFMDRRIDDPATVRSIPVTIGDDVFIGANSIILKGVTIGDRVIIGAGSVVTKNIASDEVWAGNPARLIKRIDKC